MGFSGPPPYLCFFEKAQITLDFSDFQKINAARLDGRKSAIKQLAFFHFLNKSTQCTSNMRVNPNKTTAYVLIKVSTSLDTVSKADIPYIANVKLSCSIGR